MSYKQLLILDKNSAIELNNKFIFKFNNYDIRFLNWRIKKIYYNNIGMSKIFVHCPELMDHTINSTIWGDGSPSSIIGMITSDSNHDNDRNTLYLNKEIILNRMTIFFTDENGTVLTNVNDFTILIDVEKDPVGQR